MIIKIKLINYLLLKGKKTTIEKCLLKAFKIIQKNSKKQSKNLIKLILIFFIPIFKLYKIILTEKIRISESLSFILTVLKSKRLIFHKKLSETILLNVTNNNNKYSKLKFEVQKKALLKHVLYYYRW